ncbi:MAG TPA: phosphate ABC transporter substrate-binding protein [Ktedonobacterales bacterium]
MSLGLVLALGLAVAGCAPGAAPLSLRGSLTISGSTALQPLATRAASGFMAEHPEARIAVSGGGSLAGLKAVTSGKVDIGDADVYADPGEYPDPTLSDHLVAVIPFTLIVNPDVTGVPSLTRDQIIGIFSTSKYTNWSQLGGPSLPIQAVVRPPTSGTRLTFRKYVMGGRDEKGIFLNSDSSKTVLKTVATTPGAIGYLALSVLDTTVRAIGIDGANAAPDSIESGRYPFWGYEHMYTLGDGGALASAFLSYMTTPGVQSVARSMGYIPIYDMRVAIRTTDGSGGLASLAPASAWRRDDA